MPIILNAKELNEAIKSCQSITKSEIVDISIKDKVLTLSSFKDSFFYKESFNTQSDDLEVTVNAKLLSAFLSSKDDVKLTKDNDENCIKLSCKRNRCKIPLVFSNREYFDSDIVEDSIELTPLIIGKIFDNAKYFNFTDKFYDLDTPLQVNVKNNVLQMCTLEYFYSALIEDEFNHKDFYFNLTLSYVFILIKLFSNVDNIKLSASSSKIILEDNTKKIILPKIACKDLVSIEDIKLDYSENTQKSDTLAAIKFNSDNFKSSLNNMISFYKKSGAINNKLTFNLSKEKSMITIDNEQGTCDELLDAQVKVRDNLQFGCHILCLKQMLSSMSNDCIIKFFNNRCVIYAGNIVYQLMRLD